MQFSCVNRGLGDEGYPETFLLVGRKEGEVSQHAATRQRGGAVGRVTEFALLYEDQEGCDEAEPLYEQALQLRIEMLSENRPIAGQQPGRSLAEPGGEAEPLHERVLRRRHEVLGETHRHTLHLAERDRAGHDVLLGMAGHATFPKWGSAHSDQRPSRGSRCLEEEPAGC
jgi:hypothetical protein